MDTDTLLEFEANKKSPAVAIILSLFLFAGSGTWYAGNASRGKKIVIIAIALLIFTAGIGYLIISIWSALDANKIAKQHNLTTREPVFVKIVLFQKHIQQFHRTNGQCVFDVFHRHVLQLLGVSRV